MLKLTLVEEELSIVEFSMLEHLAAAVGVKAMGAVGGYLRENCQYWTVSAVGGFILECHD